MSDPRFEMWPDDAIIYEQHFWSDPDMSVPVPTAQFTIVLHRDHLYDGWRLRARLRLPDNEVIGCDDLMSNHPQMPFEGPPLWQITARVEAMIDDIIEFTGLDL